MALVRMSLALSNQMCREAHSTTPATSNRQWWQGRPSGHDGDPFTLPAISDEAGTDQPLSRPSKYRLRSLLGMNSRLGNFTRAVNHLAVGGAHRGGKLRPLHIVALIRDIQETPMLAQRAILYSLRTALLADPQPNTVPSSEGTLRSYWKTKEERTHINFRRER